jgi:DNA-binding PadR family transcriptional regulator
MVKRRKVGNLLALAVLSVVVQRPMHPYEMATLIRERGKDDDMPIKWGSLYTVVGNMHKHGLLRAIETEKQGGRPERTVYEITEAGREELADWARELVSTPEPEHPRFKAALSVLGALGPDEVQALLRQRLAIVEAAIESRRASLEHDRGQTLRLFLLEEEYDLALREREASWIRDLIGELADNTFPDLEGWRAFHT